MLNTLENLRIKALIIASKYLPSYLKYTKKIYMILLCRMLPAAPVAVEVTLLRKKALMLKNLTSQAISPLKSKKMTKGRRGVSNLQVQAHRVAIRKKRRLKMIKRQMRRKRRKTHLHLEVHPLLQVKMIKTRRKKRSQLRNQYRKRKRRDRRVLPRVKARVVLPVQVVEVRVLLHPVVLRAQILMRKGEGARRKNTCQVLELNALMRKAMKNSSLEVKKPLRLRNAEQSFMKSASDARSLRKSTLRNMRTRYGWLTQNHNMKTSILACLLLKTGP